EGFTPHCRREGAQHGRLARREETPSERLAVALHVAEALHIDADVPAARHGQEGQAVRMRGNETKMTSIVRIYQSRLAVVAVGETHFFRAAAQVAGQEDAQGAAACGEMSAVFLEMKALGPLPFIVRENVAQERQHSLADLQRDAP